MFTQKNTHTHTVRDRGDDCRKNLHCRFSKLPKNYSHYVACTTILPQVPGRQLSGSNSDDGKGQKELSYEYVVFDVRQVKPVYMIDYIRCFANE